MSVHFSLSFKIIRLELHVHCTTPLSVGLFTLQLFYLHKFILGGFIQVETKIKQQLNERKNTGIHAPMICMFHQNDFTKKKSSNY